MSEVNPYQPPSAELAEPSAPSGELASRGARFAGAMIDGLVNAAVIFPAMYLGGVWEGFPNIEPLGLREQVLWALFGFAIALAINGWLIATSGQTVGKRVVGTRIVRSDGSRISLARYFGLRMLPVGLLNFVPIAGSLFATANVLFIFRRDRRCVHDLIAGTIVVNA